MTEPPPPVEERVPQEPPEYTSVSGEAFEVVPDAQEQRSLTARMPDDGHERDRHPAARVAGQGGRDGHRRPGWVAEAERQHGDRVGLPRRRCPITGVATSTIP